VNIATRIKDELFIEHTGRQYMGACPRCGERFTLTDEEFDGEEPFKCWVQGCGFNEKVDWELR